MLDRFSAGLEKIRYIKTMNTDTAKLRSIFYCLPLALLLSSVSVFAHDVVGLDGKPTHQHVYKNGGFGNGPISGHAAKPAGSRGIVIWDSAPSRSYAKPQTGLRIPSNPFSKRDPQRDAKSMYKQKPTFSKNQDRTPDVKPQ